MKKILIRTLALGAVATVTSVAHVWAQPAPSPVLNALAVERLVSADTREAHAQLGEHFAALAEQYSAQARRHTSMSRRLLGNPSRTLGSRTSAHCRRLAALNTQSAETLAELAAHHRALAAGTPSIPPPESARFDAGTGAPAPADEELEALAASASTPAEHGRLAEYFSTLADRYSGEADRHARLARGYRALPRGASAAASHCDRLVSRLRDAAKEAGEAAAMHEELAGTGR